MKSRRLTFYRYIVDQDDFYPTISKESVETRRNWIQGHSEIITSFESLWSIVYNVLCADAPEGNVPEEMEEAANLDTREVLSYSWRGLKEARYVTPYYTSQLC